jgi:RNA polymerase sigma-70 factor (ECF subfamily)
VLILRDVLNWQANEVADLLDLTVSAVKSALFRARTTLANHQLTLGAEAGAAPTLDEPLRIRLDHYVRAWETADVNEFVALLKADATFSMPPIPAWYQGRETIRGLVARTIFRGQADGRWRLQPTRANGQLAFGLYRYEPADHLYHAYGVQVLSLDGNEVADVTTFRNPALVPWFNLPPDLPG